MKAFSILLLWVTAVAVHADIARPRYHTFPSPDVDDQLYNISCHYFPENTVRHTLKDVHTVPWHDAKWVTVNKVPYCDTPLYLKELVRYYGSTYHLLKSHPYGDYVYTDRYYGDLGEVTHAGWEIIWLLMCTHHYEMLTLAERDPLTRDLVVLFILTNRRFNGVYRYRTDGMYRSFAADSRMQALVNASAINAPILAARLTFNDAETLAKHKPELRQIVDNRRLYKLLKEKRWDDAEAALVKYRADYFPFTEKIDSDPIKYSDPTELLLLDARIKHGRGDAIGALRHLLRFDIGTEEDIHFLCSHEIPLEHLREFCKTHCDTIHADKKNGYFGYLEWSTKTMLIRDIFARRLSEAGKFIEAQYWFQRLEPADDDNRSNGIIPMFAEQQANAENQYLDTETRAIAYLNLAYLCRVHGRPLFYHEYATGIFLLTPVINDCYHLHGAIKYYRMAAELSQNIYLKSFAYQSCGITLAWQFPKLIDQDFKKLAYLKTHAGRYAWKHHWFMQRAPSCYAKYPLALSDFESDDPRLDPEAPEEPDEEEENEENEYVEVIF